MNNYNKLLSLLGFDEDGFIRDSDLVGEFYKNSEPSTMDLTAQVIDTVLYSGFYSDTLTFTFELGTTP